MSDQEYHPIGKLPKEIPRKCYRFHLETTLVWHGVDPYDAAERLYHYLEIKGFLAQALSIECLGEAPATPPLPTKLFNIENARAKRETDHRSDPEGDPPAANGLLG
jgi:hypothetical protein